MQKLIIIGAGGFAKEVYQLVNDIGGWNIVGFIDTYSDGLGTIYNIPVLNNYSCINDSNENIDVVIAVGNPFTKKRILEELILFSNIVYPNIIHPSVLIGEHVSLGRGNIICQGSQLTVDINIGDFVIINLACTIGHDVEIEDFVTINPNCSISGNVKIHELSDIGTGSCVIQGKCIGTMTVIGAGSVVIKDIPNNCTAVGVPAKLIKEHSKGIV